MTTTPALRDSSRDGPAAGRSCPVCDRPAPSARAQYCSAACRQRAFRLRHVAPAPEETGLRATLRRRRQLAAHTVYACPSCEARLLGARRCPDCHLFCRALGLGGACPDCDAVLLLADLLPLEVFR